MDTGMWTLLSVLVLLVGVGGWAYVEARRRRLRRQFGPEYQRAVQEIGSRRRAEKVLEMRRRRVERFQIRPLSDNDRNRFAEAWRRQQARFVDDPGAAVNEADRLVAEVMASRGYPMSDFDQRAADISVHYPRFVEKYRTAHEMARRHEGGLATTEDLREAMVHYRALFEELLDSWQPRRLEATR